jgi:hypothetical protein
MGDPTGQLLRSAIGSAPAKSLPVNSFMSFFSVLCELATTSASRWAWWHSCHLTLLPATSDGKNPRAAASTTCPLNGHDRQSLALTAIACRRS